MNHALVVGAGRGIGLALVQELLAAYPDAEITATFRTRATSRGLLAIATSDSEQVEAHCVDTTSDRDFDTLAQRLGGKPPPDIVIHSAGVLHEENMQPEKTIASCERNALLHSFQVNSIGPLLLAQKILPLIPKTHALKFAALSAMVGSIGDNRLGGWYGYRASKAALNQFIKTLAIECRMKHPQTTILGIHPGTTDTPLSRPFQANVPKDKLYSPQQTARRVLGVIDASEPNQSGQFLNWDGTKIPW